MVRSRSVFVALVMVLAAPAASSQLANEPPEYFVDVQFEKSVWHEVDDGTGAMHPVAGPVAYTYNANEATGLLATWHSYHDPDIADELNFFLEDPTASDGFRLEVTRTLPSVWSGHDFHRQFIEMNWNYLVIGGWSPTLQDHLVLVYTHAYNPGPPATHNWFLTYDFSTMPHGPAATYSNHASTAWTDNVPTDDLVLYEDHICWAGGGIVRCFWDYCKLLEDEYWTQVDPPLNPGPPVPPWSTGDTTTFKAGRCWQEENFWIESTEDLLDPQEVEDATGAGTGITQDLMLPTTPTYTRERNVAIRFWEQGGELYLVVLDPLAPNGEDPSQTLRDMPKGDFTLWKHDPSDHQWIQVPLPDLVLARMPHDKGCVRGTGWGGCYHYNANTVAGANLAAVGDYVMVVETKESDLTDWQMAHFYAFNDTGVFTHHSFTNITMLFQGTFEHAVWSSMDGDTGEVLLQVKEFFQEPFREKPFYLEKFHRRGSLHHLQFNLQMEEGKSSLVAPLEDTPHRHYTTCSAVDVVRRSSNLFHTVRTVEEDLWVSFAYEDNVTKDGNPYRDNRDPSVPHPHLNDIEKLYVFRPNGNQDCDLYLCDPASDACALPEPDPNDPDHRNRGTFEDPDRSSDQRDGSNVDRDEDAENHDSADEDDAVRQDRPESSFPVDEDGDGVPENVIEDFPVDNCPGEYNPVDPATDEQPECASAAGDASAGQGKNDPSERTQESVLRPTSKLPGQAWVAMAIGLVLVLLVFLVAKRRNDEDE